ncbi:MAG: cadherin-like domain-containing protein [Nitrospira sp.]|nr:MAG: hypothetical protein E8D42_02405 [Nitrospira sp.]
MDNATGQLTYTVTAAPLNGRLEPTTAPSAAIATFTQADIDAGRLVFVHDGAISTGDSFTFTVSDGAGGAIGATTGTLTVAPFIPPPGGGGTGGSGGTGSRSGSGSGTGGGIVPSSIQSPFVPIITEAPVKNVSGAGATEDPVPRAMMANWTFARIEQPSTLIHELPSSTIEPLSTPVKKVLAVGQKLVKRLTKLAYDLECGVQEREHKAQPIGQVASFSRMALSAGFVVWILRGALWFRASSFRCRHGEISIRCQYWEASYSPAGSVPARCVRTMSRRSGSSVV